MKTWKPAVRFIAALLPISLAGGWFFLQYQIELFDPAVLEQEVTQLGSLELLLVIGLLQTVSSTAVCGFFGYLLSQKLGLMGPFQLKGAALKRTLVLSLLFGVLFSLDPWIFGSLLPEIRSPAAAGVTLNALFASVLYGGVIEEIMLRLFFMSLLAWIMWKLFSRRAETVPPGVLCAANVLTALVFAAGHLPATVSAFGGLNAVLLVRCFLLNGGFGLLFGWLYRKHGIQYAMLSHALLHLVSKAVWALLL